MYSVEVPSVTEVVQTHCAHLSRPLFSHLPPPHEISTAIFPCQGLILWFFLCQDPHLSLLTGYGHPFPLMLPALPAPPHHTKSRYLQLSPWGQFVQRLPFLFSLLRHFTDLLSSTYQPHSTPFPSPFFSLLLWFVSKEMHFWLSIKTFSDIFELIRCGVNIFSCHTQTHPQAECKAS